MTCEEIRNELLTGPPDQDHAHLQHCEDCRAIAITLGDCWSELDAELYELGRALPYVDAVAQVPSDLRERKTNRTRFGISNILLYLVAAAALLSALPSLQAPIEAAASAIEAVDLERTPLDPELLLSAKARVAEIANLKPGDESALGWLDLARELRSLYQQVEPHLSGGNAELRGLGFRLTVQMGRCAEISGYAQIPFVQVVDGQSVNVGWYLASRLADPQLMASIDADVATSIQVYIDDRATECTGVPENRFSLRLPRGAWRGGATRVDVVLDGVVALTDVRLSCTALDQIWVEVPIQGGPELQRQVSAANDVKIRVH